MYRKNLMRVCLAAIMAATVVTTSVPVYAATEKPVEKVTAEAKSAEKAKLNVVYVLDNGRGTQVHKETVESLGAGPKDEKWTFTYGVDFNVPTGYEVSEEQDMSKVNMQVNFGGEGYLAILVKEKAGEEKAEKAKLNVVYVLDNNRGTQVHKETVESLGAGPKNEKWTFTFGDDFNVPTGYEVSEEQDMSKVNMQVNFGGEGYLAILVKEKAGEEKAEKAKLNVVYVLDNNRGTQVHKETVESLGAGPKNEKWTFTFGDDFNVPTGYEVSEEQDMSKVNMQVNFGGEGYLAILVKEKAGEEKAEKAKLNVVYVLDNNRGTQVHKETVESLGAGPKNEKWTFTFGDDFNVPTGYEVSEEQDMSKVNMQVNFGGEGYLAILVTEKPETVKKTTLNITFETKDGEVVGTDFASTTVQGAAGESWTFMLGTDFLLPEGYKLAEGVEQDTNVEVPFGAAAGHTVIVEKIVNEKTVYVSYIDEETKKPFENGIEEIKVASDANSFNASILKKVPAGYEVCVTGDITFEGDTVNVEVRKAEKTVYVSYIDEETKMPFENGIEEIKLPADANSFNASILKKVPAGYEVCVTGDIAFEGDTVNVEVRKAEKTVYVSYIDEETKMPFENGIEEIKVAADANSFNTSILKKVPARYEVCVTGDIAFEGDTVNVEVRKAEKTVYVSYIDEETKKPFENGIEEIKLPADANSFNASILKKVPAGYEVCVTGDIAFKGDTVNVEVRKAEKTVYVSYIDEETKMPFENGIEEIKLPADANSFNTSILKKVPAGYEVCVTGDIAFEGDTVNVEVRKLAAEEKTVYVSYIDEETKMPFENGIETIKLAKNATYFNTSLLKEVPAGYELCEVGDVYIGENDTVNVEVRKIKEEPETPVDPDKPVNPEKPVKPQEDDKDKDNQKDDKKDEDDKKSPKTSDEASPLAATATAGLSLAAILALLKKRR